MILVNSSRVQTILIWLVVSLEPCFSQALKQGTKEVPLIEELMSRLAATQPEFEADALLQMVVAAKIPEAEVKLLLERVYLQSGRAQLAYQETVAARHHEGIMGFSSPSMIAAAGELRLDQLSLRLRTILLMKDRDLKRAAEMFDELSPTFRAATCDDSFSPKPRFYYQVLSTLHRGLAQHTNPKIREGADLWLARHLYLTHDSQIEGAAKLVAQYGAKKDTFEFLSGQLAQGLKQLSPQPRAQFGAFTENAEAILELAKKQDLLGIPTTPLFEAFQSYLKKGMTGPRCKDLGNKVAGQLLEPVVPRVVEYSITEELKKSFANLASLEAKEFIDAHLKYDDYQKDTRYLKLMEDFRELKYGPLEKRREVVSRRRADGMEGFLPLEERKSAAWNLKLEKFLKDLLDYQKADQKDPIEHFVKVAGTYAQVIEITPSTAESLRNTVSAYLLLLSTSSVRSEYPAVWALEFRKFLRRGLLDEPEQGKTLVRDAIRQAGDQRMNTLMEVENFRNYRGVL